MAFQTTAFQPTAFQTGDQAGVAAGLPPATSGAGPTFTRTVSYQSTFTRSLALVAVVAGLGAVGTDFSGPTFARARVPSQVSGTPLTLLAAAPKPFAQVDWPNPRGAIRSVTLGGWNSGLGLTVVPFFQEDWPNPRGPKPTVFDWEDSFKLPLTTHKPPFTQYDWPNPRGQGPRADWSQSGLALATSVVVYPAQITFDWPNPRGPIPSVSLKTHIASGVFYLGQDQFPNGVSRVYDYPNPRGAKGVDGFTNPALTFATFDFGNPIRPKDWPNPLGPKPLPVTWSDSFKLPLTTHKPPFTQYDWPNPRGFTRNAIIGGSNPGLTIAPFFQVDWPNPRGLGPRADWSQTGLSLQTAVIVYPAQITFDWPNPRGAIPAASLRTWTDSFKLPLTTHKPPFTQYDWPNPRGLGARTDWSQQGPALQIAATAKPFLQEDWPNPRGYTRKEDLSWTRRSNLSLLVVPFNQENWPNPSGKLPPNSTWAWVDRFKLPLTTHRPPFIQRDWPNPKGFIPNIVLRTEWFRWPHLFPAPPSDLDPACRVIDVFGDGVISSSDGADDLTPQPGNIIKVKC